tara:strand:- start:3973 stop:4242 length:270 start_codon:yes stop_codon:yes gene_type:complete
MTIELFLKRHGENWEKLKRDPLFTDLIEAVRSCDPARAMHLVSAKDATDNTQHLLGRIAGFNLALNVIDGISLPQDSTPPEETWADKTL